MDKSAVTKWNNNSAITFLQQEHSATLKALHSEIEALQKQCADLTFQLTMQGLAIDGSGKFDNDMQKVQDELEQTREKMVALEKELSERDKKVEKLELEAKTQRKRWLDENRLQLQTMNTLRAELEAKANNIAYLTAEMNKMKQKIKTDHSEPATNPSISFHGGHAHMEASIPIIKKPVAHQHYFPVPPAKDKTMSLSTGNTRIRRSNKHGGDLGKASKLPNQLMVSPGRSSGSESPDITSFLPLANQEIPVIEVKQPPILPPIPVSAATLSSFHPVSMHRVVSATSHYPQKKTSLSTKTELVSLAIENAANAEASWKLTESRSSEYN
uniref:CCDC92/74 N-terminal domain-containing protein n=1 Tax=Biomphalaria glabrata TaxID=6526 RepID=A0A2C9LE81_BIOGL